MKSPFVLLSSLIFLTACLPQIPPSQPAQPVTIGTQVIDETFDSGIYWDSFNIDGLQAQADKGAYSMLLTEAAGLDYFWSRNRAHHTNVIIEADVWFESDYERAVAGIMCRATTAGNARAYYFLISANGAFSIRRGLEQSTDPLMKWQSNSAIHTDGRRNIIRAVCVDEYLGMYVNGDYLDSAFDDRYNAGVVGMVIGRPDSTQTEDISQVRFDNLRVWDAQR